MKESEKPSLRIRIGEAKTGMVLAADAVNPAGALILRAGQSLNEKNIRVLKSWGVGSLLIVQEEPEPVQEEAEAAPANDIVLEEEMKRRFARCLDDPTMAEIMRIALELKLKRRKNEPEPSPAHPKG